MTGLRYRVARATRITAHATALCAILAAPALVLAQQPAQNPAFDASAFRGGAVDNTLFPLRPGAVFVLALTEDGKPAVDSITVLSDTKRISGVTATVVHDRVRRAGALTEDTYDWYAQDTTGTVWYLGEDTKAYRAGKVASTAGSWQAGIHGAKAGIIMKARPRPGDAYRQEYRPGLAQDMGRVVSVDDTVTVPAGHFAHCVTTEDTSPLEPGVREHKVYCPGVGVVREQIVAGGNERSELIAMTRP